MIKNKKMNIVTIGVGGTMEKNKCIVRDLGHEERQGTVRD